VIRLAVVAGAPAEAVRLAPVVAASARRPDLAATLVSALDDEWTTSMWDAAGVWPDVVLPAGPTGLTSVRQSGRLLPVLERTLLDAVPDAVLLAGDSPAALAAALEAGSLGLPVVRIGGGDTPSSGPTTCSVVVDHLAALHLVVDGAAADRLRAQGIATDLIEVVGSTAGDLVVGRSYADHGDRAVDAPVAGPRLGSGRVRDVPILIVIDRGWAGREHRELLTALTGLRGWGRVGWRWLVPADRAGVAGSGRAVMPDGMEPVTPASWGEHLDLLAEAAVLVTDDPVTAELGVAVGVPAVIIGPPWTGTDVIHALASILDRPLAGHSSRPSSRAPVAPVAVERILALPALAWPLTRTLRFL
jgi:hypothetical protein